MKTKLVSYDEYEIISGEDVEMDPSEIFELIELFSWNRSSFITFPINDTNSFQLVYGDEDKFIVEITNDNPDMIFHQKYATKNEVKELINYIYHNDITKEVLSKFYQVPVCSRTLDDVIKELSEK